MPYVAPGTVAAGDVYTAAAHNIQVANVINHETRLLLAPQVIETKTLTGTAAIDFTSIPATYTSLQLVWRLRGSEASAVTGVFMSFNGDVASNYTQTEVQVLNAAVSGSSSTSTGVVTGVVPGSTGTANLFGTALVTIAQYANTSYYKQVTYLTGYANTTAAASYVRHGSGMWASNSAINRITLITSSASTFLIGSSVTLIGIP